MTTSLGRELQNPALEHVPVSVDLYWQGPQVPTPHKSVEDRRLSAATGRHKSRNGFLMGNRWPLRREDLVFVTTNGTPIGPSNIRRVISRMAVEAGIDGDLNPYELRHTATSLLSAAGVAPELLADVLGHRDTRMVFRHYRHQVTPTISVAADHIERALAQGAYQGA